VLHVVTIGTEARHARLGAEMPKQTMTRSEGEQFIRELADAWLATLTV
jgi:hypothetical protein